MAAKKSDKWDEEESSLEGLPIEIQRAYGKVLARMAIERLKIAFGMKVRHGR